jgi:hypothetical protein
VLSELICESDNAKFSMCERCDENSGTYNCTNCKTILCDNCAEEIHSKGVYRHHNLKKVTKSTMI